MDERDQFIRFGLGMLGYQSKQDLIENLFIKSIYDSYNRIDKNIAKENDIRDRFIYDFYHNSTLLKGWVNKNILFVNWERWVFKNAEDLGRTDMSFAMSGIEFIIECKRLKSASPKYISDGLNRLIKKEYAENESYAGMIGFVIDGNIKSICSSLMETCKQVNYIESEFTCSKIDEPETSFNTTHNRDGSDDINVYHLFLEFNMK